MRVSLESLFSSALRGMKPQSATVKTNPRKSSR